MWAFHLRFRCRFSVAIRSALRKIELPQSAQKTWAVASGNALGAAEDRVAAEVLVALLNKPIKHSPFNGSRNNG
jgi:hypothetical protein